MNKEHIISAYFAFILISQFTVNSKGAEKGTLVCSHSFKSDLSNGFLPILTDQVLIGPTGEPMTFSHDTELPPDLIAKMLIKNAEIKKSLQEKFIRFKTWQDIYNYLVIEIKLGGGSIPRAENFEQFQKTFLNDEAQLILHSEDSVSPFDLKPKFLAWLLPYSPRFFTAPLVTLSKHSNISYENLFAPGFFVKKEFTPAEFSTWQIKVLPTVHAQYLAAMKEVFKSSGITSLVTLDMGLDIELKTEGSLTTLKDLKVQISQIQSQFQKYGMMATLPNVHFHVGIPLNIGEEKAIAVAQIVETKLVLERLAKGAVENAPDLLYTEGSSLGQNGRIQRIPQRGLINYNFDEFTVPVKAMDFEIRQWLSIKHGLSLVQMTIDLAENYKILPVPLMSGTLYNRDKRFGNILDALRLLMRHLDAGEKKEFKEIYSALEKRATRGRADRAIMAQYLPDRLLEELRDLLKSYNIIERMNHIEFFTDQINP